MRIFSKKKRMFLSGAYLMAALLSGLPQTGWAVADGRNGEVTESQQQKRRTVTGTITDAADGSPLIGASIALKNKQTGVISDIDGNYSIEVNSSLDVLVVS